jgi:signal transduction histidine kinase
MRRLYLQIYAACVGVLVLFGLLVLAAWGLAGPREEERLALDGFAALLSEALPPAGAPPGELQAAIARLAARFPADVAVHGPDGRLLAATGAELPPPPDDARSGFLRGPRGRGTLALRLPDGRWLLARRARPFRAPAAGGAVAALGLLALAIALGAYPVARRLTGRLERLRARVEALGLPDLSARVEVEGRDEVAALARSFNSAAERIERLVGAQQALLASVSHELRSPLARIRMAVELLGRERPELVARIARDVEELDALIGELLLASRLDARAEAGELVPVDLLALVAEEAARSGAETLGEPASVRGDPRLLRRLVRNLLENARRHGGGTPVEASVARLGAGGARLRVADRGPGVPEAERERIFEPFYRPPGHREGDGGVGLGLALVRRIARHHGGEARCLPREGGGSCFEVELGSPGAG